MFEKLGVRLSSWARQYMPDPFVLALLLTLLSLLLAWVYVGFETTPVLTAWTQGTGDGKGFWNLLAFGMQMCLILVTGHALAESPPVAKALNALADRVRSPAAAVIVVALAAMVLALVNWGLGLIAGALLARKVGQRAREQHIALHYPLVVAAGYTAMLVWHGGLSGSAPLKVTLEGDLAQVLGAETAAVIGSIPLSQTVGSAGNALVNLTLLLLVPLVLLRMQPSAEANRVPAPALCSPPEDAEDAGDPEHAEHAPVRWGHRAGGALTLAQRLDNSRLLTLCIVGPALVALGLWVHRQGLGRLDLNVINFAFLFTGMLLHGSPRSYLRSMGEAARGCSGIILQFPFYAGIMGLLAGTGLLQVMASTVARVGSGLLPAVGFYMAGLVNLFVPSGGGQWAVQGPLLVEAGLRAGVEPARMVMALAYGDQWTNMLQPFWALPLLAIAGVRARDVAGYTAVLLLVSQVVFIVGLYLPV
jgi:short-chain fatty acids transporter